MRQKGADVDSNVAPPGQARRVLLFALLLAIGFGTGSGALSLAILVR